MLLLFFLFVFFFVVVVVCVCVCVCVCLCLCVSVCLCVVRGGEVNIQRHTENAKLVRMCVVQPAPPPHLNESH